MWVFEPHVESRSPRRGSGRIGSRSCAMRGWIARTA
jgi:hypothetical protein